MTAELEKALEEENRLRAELEAERSSRTEIQKQKEDLEKELASLQQQKTELESQMQLVDGELKKAQEELEEKTASLSSTTLNQTQQELTIQTLNNESQAKISQMQQDLGKYAEEVKTLTHTNKIKDRALSCLNQEINKLKLGSHYSTVL
ncbi:hypothetical protein JH06_4640 [Blastocystis sp. subtype 4]|uniref:hypothetical protein n=1 Tax=Blastocystis sp. subtype 4 TaxID=944170 RepID=UPI0007116D9F|nr:hypothetical protein JH06_4640 [Blastocystis sp. subtype 4]KNB46200.1 hypothetical protein JH06_4640 [Blastocystis sp. subtype 4]|eukprot:XP_014529643.1 hypothetical protein JH06_4640 [Blastocystis sp. subtype 4]